MIRRRLDWRSRLQAWASAQEGKPFVWGQTDCGSLARSALETMFGVDVVPWLPKYTTRPDAVKAKHLVVQFGLALQGLGAQASAPAFMRAGDLVVMPEAGEDVGHESLLVCIDARRCLTCTRDGVVFVDVAIAAQATAFSLWEVNVDG